MKLIVNAGETEVTLTMEQARELWEELNVIFKESKTSSPLFPTDPKPLPWGDPYTIKYRCDS